MRDARPLLVPALLLLQPAVVYLVAGKERPPAPPNLTALPLRIGAWTSAGYATLEAEVAAATGADCLLSRSYANGATGETADLLVAWYRSQRNGTRQPHSPKVCLPGAGWLAVPAGVLQVESRLGAVTVNRVLAAKGGASLAVLYWYQTPRRAVAGEWAAKVWLVIDALRDRRTDTALVRVVVPVTRDDDTKALRAAADFVAAAYPQLRECLPR